ncbi:MAG: F0F1 ATP synthase subunit gamma [Deltaproteobacteria bacterium]|jgi:F-type H+-transporting ATPase subunit gamma|nr:F0F1 ATP synthase subunit gamma [Deltaproteobacteria bacterium]
MAALKDIRLKIVGVRKTKQITKAMNMVASAKLRGAQTRIERFRPYAAKFRDMLGELSGKAEEGAHPLLTVHEETKVCVIVLVTSDRGLCGSFNANLIQAANRLAREKSQAGATVKFICVGKKGRDFVRKTSYEILLGYSDKMGHFDFSLAHEVGMEVVNGYQELAMDEVYLIYGEFASMSRQIPTTLPLLPLRTPEASAQKDEAASGAQSEYVYEPQEEALLAELLPRYVKVQIYRGMLDTSCSEHAARMAAMDNATRNCDDMIRSLTRLFNKVRQAGITSDLMDIVGGAEALKG